MSAAILQPRPPLELSTAILESHIAAARKLIAAEGVDALFLYAAPRKAGGGNSTSGNVHYFAGWSSMGGASVMLIAAKGKPVILASGPNDTRMYTQRSAALAEVRRCNGPNGMVEEAARALADLGLSAKPVIGLAGMAEMPAPFYAKVAALGELRPLDRPLQAMRLVKSDDEIALHRRAAEISDAMIAACMAQAQKPGITPMQLMADVEHAGRELGADMATLWLATGETPPVTWMEFFELPASIGPRDRIQLGTNVVYEGHFAQGLRIGVRGTPSPQMQDAAALLIEMQNAALAKLVPGKPLSEIVDTLEALIDQNCPFTRKNDPFRFQSCHGMGLNYAEPAMVDALSPDRDRALDAERPLVVENMILQIHPNFTVPGLGHICAGDVARVTATGAEWLTRYPRGLVRLD